MLGGGPAAPACAIDLDGHAAPVAVAIDRESDEGTDDRADPARGRWRERGIAGEQELGEEAADKGTDDAQDDRSEATHRVGAGHKEPSNDTDDRAEDEPGDDGREIHSWLAPFLGDESRAPSTQSPCHDR